jgi:flagellar motility protein MotE (MotC chaperone)
MIKIAEARHTTKCQLALVSAIFSALGLAASPIAAIAEGREPETPAHADTEDQPPPKGPITPASQYCMNVRDAAESARMEQQRGSLAKAQRDIDERIALLTTKTTEYQQWLNKRDEFLKKANDTLVEIYSRLKPEAAAAQMLAMNEGVAAAIISKMTPKTAGAILSEMDAGRAARLSSYLAGAAEITEHLGRSEGSGK